MQFTAWLYWSSICRTSWGEDCLVPDVGLVLKIAESKKHISKPKQPTVPQPEGLTSGVHFCRALSNLTIETRKKNKHPIVTPKLPAEWPTFWKSGFPTKKKAHKKTRIAQMTEAATAQRQPLCRLGQSNSPTGTFVRGFAVLAGSARGFGLVTSALAEVLSAKSKPQARQ